MKKMVVVFILIIFGCALAYAEEPVVYPSDSAPTEPAVQSHKTRKVVIVPNTESIIRRGMQNATKVIETKVGIKIGEAFINFEERQVARDKQRDEQFAKKDTQTAKAVTTLRNDLIDPKSGALPNLQNNIQNSINSTVVFTAICLGGVVLVVGGILAFSIRCSRNQVVAAVDEIPKKVSSEIKKLETRTFKIENVLGITFLYDPKIRELPGGSCEYIGLHVPEGVAMPNDIADIFRLGLPNANKLCNSVRSDLVDFIERLKNANEASLSQREKQQKLLLEKLIKQEGEKTFRIVG